MSSIFNFDFNSFKLYAILFINTILLGFSQILGQIRILHCQLLTMILFIPDELLEFLHFIDNDTRSAMFTTRTSFQRKPNGN